MWGLGQREALACGQREEMPRERWEQRQLGNSSWGLGQPQPGAVPRKSEVILEERQRSNFQHPLEDGPRRERTYV